MTREADYIICASHVRAWAAGPPMVLGSRAMTCKQRVSSAEPSCVFVYLGPLALYLCLRGVRCQSPGVVKAGNAPSAFRGMALSILSGDELEVIFLRLCNPFDTRVAMAFGSASRGLWEPTQVARQQLRAQSEAAAALCQRAGIPSCKKLREATTARWSNLAELSIAELAMLGALGSVVPSLKSLYLFDNVAAPGGMRQLAEGLGAGALPAVTRLVLGSMRMGDAGAAALAAALDRGALPRIEVLDIDR